MFRAVDEERRTRPSRRRSLLRGFLLALGLFGVAQLLGGTAANALGNRSSLFAPIITARTWTGAASTNFNTAGNWSPTGVPGASDALTIPGNVASHRYPVINTTSGNVNASSIAINNGGSLTSTSVTLTVAGDLTNNGTFGITGSVVTVGGDFRGTGISTMSGPSTLKVGRDWRLTGGSFTATGGTVEFTGVADSNTTFAGAPTQFVNIVVDAGADPRFSNAPGSTIPLTGNFTNDNPALDVGPNATFVFNGATGQTISSASTAGNATFGNLTVNKAAGILSNATDARLSGDLTVAAGKFDTGAGSADRTAPGGTISVANGSSLRLGGTNTFPTNYSSRNLAPNSTVDYKGGDQVVASGSYGNLRVSGNGAKSADGALDVAGDFSVADHSVFTALGNIDDAGDLVIGPNAQFFAGPYTHHVQGTFNNSASWFGANTGTFVFDGSGPQVLTGLSGTLFRNLTINNPDGVTMKNYVTVTRVLSLSSGTLDANGNVVVVGAKGSVSRGTGWVAGRLRKQIDTNGEVTRTFEVGTATSYTPVTLTAHNVIGGAAGGLQNLTVMAHSGDHPQIATSGLFDDKDVNVYWSLFKFGTWVFTGYDTTFNYGAGDVDPAADPSAFKVRVYTGGVWFGTTVGTHLSTVTSAVALLTFQPIADFAIGEGTGDPTSTLVSCPSSTIYATAVSCTATVTNTISGAAPVGTVTFATDSVGAFSNVALCTLVPATAGVSTCSLNYTPTAVDTGTHNITGSYTAASGFADSATADPAVLSVLKAALTITANNQSKLYGALDPAFTSTYTGLVNGDTATETPPFCLIFGAHSDVAGSPYTIGCGLAADPNYTISYAVGHLSVLPAPLTITADDASKVYGALDSAFTAGYTGLTNGDTAPATLPTCGVSGAHVNVAGSPYPITCSGAADTNYTISYAGGALSILRAPLMITPANKSKVYGVTDPAFTFGYSGLVNGDTAPATLPTCGVSGAHVTVAGSPYTITCSGASDGNYTISYGTGTLNITPAALTVAANNKSKLYGAADPVFNAGYTGLANGDTAPSTAPTCSVSVTHVTVLGSPYAITCSGASDTNYTISYTGGSLNITPTPLTVTALNKSKVYGAADPVFNAGYTGLANGDTAPATAPTCGVSGAHEDLLLSPFVISCSGAADPNYSISYVNGALTILPAPATVTADNKTKLYGLVDPTLTYSVAGAGANFPVINCSVVGVHVVVGSYPIACSGSSPYYSITFVNGTLGITPTPLTIAADNKTKHAGQPDPAFTVTYIGLMNGDTHTATLPTCGVSGAHNTIGIYTITCSGAVDPNYTIAYLPGTLTVIL